MNTDPQPGIFQDKGVFLNYEHVDKNFMYSIQKNCSAGGNFGVFSPRFSENRIFK